MGGFGCLFGLVFLDAATSDGLEVAKPWFGTLRAAAPLAVAAARVGLFRVLDPFDIPTDSDQGRISSAMTYSASAIGTLAAFALSLALTRVLVPTARHPVSPPDR